MGHLMVKCAVPAFVALLMTCASASAQTSAPPSGACAPPKLLNSLALEPTPGGDTMTVATRFDGKPQRLLLGISDGPTQLWQSRAAELGLPVRLGRRIMDGGGRISEEVA